MSDVPNLVACSGTSPKRARQWQLKNQKLQFDQLPAIMGIVNVTPDSFSDGGRFFDAQRAIDHGLKLKEQGATLLDIGGESTRPNADPVSETEELKRVIQVVQALSEKANVPISIDTSKASVAKEAVAAGAEIINDVTGLEGDSGMIEVAAATQAGVCAMHMRGTPRTMQETTNLQYGNVVEDIMTYLEARKSALLNQGIDLARICLDPGIGFAKTTEHNLALLRRIDVFHGLETPILVGHSRKGFLAKLIGDQESDRTAATVGVTLALALAGVQVVRVHDVAAAREALICFAAAGGLTRPTSK